MPHPSRNRKSTRLHGYDYVRPGSYFVTICTNDRVHLFGEVADGKMHLNDAGRTVAQAIRQLPRWFSRVRVGSFVVMPNHLHVIISIRDRRGDGQSAIRNRRRGEASNRPSTHADPGTTGERTVPFSAADASPLQPTDHLPPQPPTDQSPPQPPAGHSPPQPTADHPPPQPADHSPTQPTDRSASKRDPGPHSPLQGAADADPSASRLPTGTVPRSLGAIVQNLKSVTARRINRMRRNSGRSVWQRNYWDRVIRNHEEYARIDAYIRNNPRNWKEDRFYR